MNLGAKGGHTNIESVALSPESLSVWKPSYLQVPEVLAAYHGVLPRTCLKEASFLKFRSPVLGR